MDVIVEFNEAAFRHNINKEDIMNALKTKIYAAALEVLYDPIDDNSIYIFHAMRARKSTLKLIGL